jgi:hypothetical protein
LQRARKLAPYHAVDGDDSRSRGRIECLPRSVCHLAGLHYAVFSTRSIFWHAGRGEVLRRLLLAWERGDIEDLTAYPRWCECLDTERERAWHRRLNDQRNVVLASRIAALHAAGQRVFAAVGSLHFTGPQALHDLLARSATTSLRRWLGGPETMGHTNLTIGIAPIDVMVERAAAATRYPSLKLKVGLGGEEELIRRVREVYHGPLRLDANCGWTLERALELLPLFERSNVELLEQPLRPGRIKNMAALAAATEIPVIADEDCIVYDDIEQLVGLVDGVNLKQVKIGGLGPSLRGFRKAESLGLRRMFGSMVETKLGIAGAAAVAGAAEFLDLDGPIGLIGDPFTGLELDDQCRWILDDSEPGSGVTFNPTARG